VEPISPPGLVGAPTGLEYAPARRRRSDVLILAAAVATLIVVAAIAVIVIVPKGDRTYAITMPAQAGGLIRNGTASTLGPSTIGYRNIQQVVTGRPRTAVAALYQDPPRKLLLTVQAATGDFGDPADLPNRIRAHPPQAGQQPSLPKVNTSWTRLAATDPGPHGGRAVCGELSVSLSQLPPTKTTFTDCAWQTRHTFVYLSAPVSPLSVADLAEVMRRMRLDLEKPA
jgi:hypothetical protein